MILTKYLARKFFTYLVTASTSIALLYNLIEFFEKLMRAHHATLSEISVFILLNLLPSFFELLPVSIWLATCLLIRELYLAGGWENLSLLSVRPHEILRHAFIGGAVLCTLSLVGKEWAINQVTKKVTHYKMKRLKSAQHQKIYNRWFCLDQQRFINIDYLDLTMGSGEGLLLLELDEQFLLKKRIWIPHFELTSSTNTIQSIKTNASVLEGIFNTTHKKLILHLPELVANLRLNAHTPTLTRLASTLFSARRLLSPQTLHRELCSFFMRILTHLQPLIYTVLPLGLFLLFPPSSLLLWAGILAIYPLFLIVTTISHFLSQHYFPAWIVTIPYLLAFFGMLALRRFSLREI